jgi:hypothetical protein
MAERRAFRGLPLAGAAAAGTLVGHWAAYLLAFPHAHARAEMLSEAGHGYWGSALKVVTVLALAGLGALVVRTAAVPNEPMSGFRTFTWVFRRLAVLQILAFVCMEVVERMVAGAPLGALLGHDVFVLGLALQVAVAGLATVVLLAFGWTIVRVWSAMRRPRIARPPRVLAPVRVATSRSFDLSSSIAVRGPPSP